MIITIIRAFFFYDWRLTFMIYFPTLSEEGYETSSTAIADNLFSHAFLSDYNQTSLFSSYVTSIPYIIQSNLGDIDKTAKEVKYALSNYFSNYFNDITINVSYKDEEDSRSKVALTITASMYDDEGKHISLGKLIESDGVKVTKIISINNTGA